MIEKPSVFDRTTVRDVLTLAGVTTEIDRALTNCPIPGHDDSTASFKIVDDRGWHCFGCNAKGGVADLIVALGLTDTHADAAKWLEQSTGTTEWVDVAVYAYRDAAGVTRYEAVRRERTDRGVREKKFTMRVPRAGGGYDFKLNGTPRVLYRLPEILEARAPGARSSSSREKKMPTGLRKPDSLRRQTQAAPRGSG